MFQQKTPGLCWSQGRYRQQVNWCLTADLRDPPFPEVGGVPEAAGLAGPLRGKLHGYRVIINVKHG
jgi:hypothetical protein